MTENVITPENPAEREPQVLQEGILHLGVCVPEEWTDEQVTEWVNSTNPSGTSAGWGCRSAERAAELDTPLRTPCTERKNCVHIILEC